ncbi:hypothetical protein [Paenibacillus sp. GP183]|jgi:hypothetical protein|uniref:hypothetical protein n=1 Tax=Paenibacillus sp. GP183 TaxID=1882751 RepID=UPI00089490E0|nr:hypothetical protein [Paenibacillus sp. GP183]SEC60220.1 hypothetical protein SAMN05443246_4662 [Paenibacillus sp. GP183]
MNRKFKNLSVLVILLIFGVTVWATLQRNWAKNSKFHPSSITIERIGELQQVKQEPPTILPSR